MNKFLLGLLCILLIIESCSKNNGSSNKSNSSPTISGLACSTSSFSALATSGKLYNSTATIAYTGGNQIAYPAGTSISSIGVTGLSAILQPGTLGSNTGNLTYSITGTPSSSGTASFPISFGGQSCTISLTVNSSSGGPSLPAVYSKIYGASSITYDGTNVTIKSADLPDHYSCYYPTTNSLYQSFSGPTVNNTSFKQNPNSITSQNITLTIPANPVVATTHASTPLGVMGIALDGVPLFNQYAAGGVALSGEISGFDQFYGHPQQNGMYHYHLEPLYLTTVKGSKSSLIGFLLDGFPVYGPQEADGTSPSGLDVYHGHTHSTVDYPNGIYHYHVENSAPYINGNGFYGSPGTVSQ